MRFSIAALFALALCVTACGKDNFFATPAVQTSPPPVPIRYNVYHAYGDSITAGVGVSDPSLTYAGLASTANAVPLSNFALGGEESCDLAPHQIFAQADAPSLASNGLYSVLIGTNDVDIRGAGSGESTFNLCHQAALAWLATPQEYKLLATDASVSVSGATHLDTLAGFNAVTTDSQGASVTFSFKRSVAAPVYLWYRLSDGHHNTFTCLIDGVALPVVATAPTPEVFTQNGSNDSMGVLRIAAIPAGTHSLRCAQNNAGGSGMGLIAIGGPPPAGTLKRPRVLAGLLTPQIGTGQDATIQAYDSDVNRNVQMFADDGLDVEVFDSAAYLVVNTSDYSDHIHPNATGQQAIYTAFQQKLNQPVPR